MSFHIQCWWREYKQFYPYLFLSLLRWIIESFAQVFMTYNNSLQVLWSCLSTKHMLYDVLCSYIHIYLHAGVWQTSWCFLHCPALQHEQKQSGQPVLQRGSRRFHLHGSQTVPKSKAHWFWGSGNSVVSTHGASLCVFIVKIYPYGFSNNRLWILRAMFGVFLAGCVMNCSSLSVGHVPTWRLRSLL